jgi:hypothetical protein
MDIRKAFLACAKYHKEQGELIDRILYTLCVNYPDHKAIGEINAKLWLIGRGFATGIERQIRSSGTQGSSLSKLAEHLLRNRTEIDAIIASLRQLSEPLDLDKLPGIVQEHGKFCRILSGITKHRKPVSFASKYLHFHSSAVPIFDSWVYGQAWKMRDREKLKAFPMPKGANPDFYWYCLCFWQVYSELRKLRPDVTVRLTECFLMWQASV